MNPFTQMTKRPDMTLKVEAKGESSIELVIEELGGDILLHWQKNHVESPKGKPLPVLFPEDRDAVSEWEECVLRAQRMPFIQPNEGRNEDGATIHMLQRLALFGDWKIVAVTTHKQVSYVGINFVATREFGEQATLRQLMTLKQMSGMFVHLLHGGEWTIDSMNRRICLSEGLARVLEMGDRSMVVELEDYIKLIDQEDLDRVLTLLDGIGASPIQYDNRFSLSGGRTVHMRSQAAPVYDAGGKLARIYGFAGDITEYVRDMEELSRSRHRFLQIAENTDDLFIVIGEDGELVYLSPNTAEITGIIHQDGVKIDELFADNRKKNEHIRQIIKFIQDKTTGRVEFRVTIASGGYRWYSVAFFPIYGNDGERMETVGIGHDVTDQRKKEEFMRYLVRRDVLTRLYNRRHFFSALADLQKKQARDYCIVLVDINGLKLINNVYGYQKGDKVLAEVAAVIKNVFQDDKMIARVGGGEFAVIVQNADIKSVELECEKIGAFNEEACKRFIPFSIAWGSACLHEVQGNAQELVKIAGARMMLKKTRQGFGMRGDVVHSLTEALRSANAETMEHMRRMELMVTALGEKLGLLTHDADRLALLASMHDVGKLSVPDHILNKPGPLTDEEWTVMRGHTEIGYRIAMSSQQLSGIAMEILCHHERWDGKGYPTSRKGDEIPLLSQIISVVDAYDVMTHARVYKNASSHEEAMRELRRCMGTQFSPRVVTLFSDTIMGIPPERLL